MTFCRTIVHSVFRRNVVGKSEDISICVFQLRKFTNEQAFNHINRALTLIQQTSSPRFQRIKKELKYIVASNICSHGAYIKVGRMCLINLDLYDFATDVEWYTVQLACQIIHQASAGWLLSKHVQCRTNKNNRISKICKSQENMFLSKLNACRV